MGGLQEELALEIGLNHDQLEKQMLLSGGVDISNALVSLAEVIPDPVPILLQIATEVPIFTAKGLSMVVGASKSRKTTLAVGLVAALLGDKSLGLEASRDDFKVVFIDTEQGRQYAAMTLRKIHRMLGWDIEQDNDRLKYYDLREYSKEDRMAAVEYIARTERPNVMFIDGIVDLCKNFNDIAESELVVQGLMKLTVEYDMHICGCLHFNKDNTTARGHLGAIYMQKCETVMKVENKGEYSVVTPHPEGCRLKPFTKFCITMHEEYYYPLPFDDTQLTILTLQQKPRPRDERAKVYAGKAFKAYGNRPMFYGDLVKAITEASKADNILAVTSKTAKNYIRLLVDNGFLIKDNDRYVLASADKDHQQSMTFNDPVDPDDPDNTIGESMDDDTELPF